MFVADQIARQAIRSQFTRASHPSFGHGKTLDKK